MPHTDPQLAGMIERAETLLADFRRMTPAARAKLAAQGISEREIETLRDAFRATAQPGEVASSRRRPSQKARCRQS